MNIHDFCSHANTTKPRYSKYISPNDDLEHTLKVTREPIFPHNYNRYVNSTSDHMSILINSEDWLGIGIETAIASESSLAKDWLSPEEDEAWRDL